MSKFIKSFYFAFKGIAYAATTQRNLQVHLLAVIVVSATGIYFHISTLEWIAVFCCFALVISLELMNTAFELLADALHPGPNAIIGKAKDVAAAAVLIAAIFAVIIAILIFGKYIFNAF
jgi:diacylglycerol kinase (ATP)